MDLLDGVHITLVYDDGLTNSLILRRSTGVVALWISLEELDSGAQSPALYSGYQNGDVLVEQLKAVGDTTLPVSAHFHEDHGTLWKVGRMRGIGKCLLWCPHGEFHVPASTAGWTDPSSTADGTAPSGSSGP